MFNSNELILIRSIEINIKARLRAENGIQKFGFGFLGLNLGFGTKPKTMKKKSQSQNQNFFGFSELNFRKIRVSIHHSICLDELITNMSLFSLKSFDSKVVGLQK